MPDSSPLVLVIEDDEHITLAIRMCLERAGYRVETAMDGVDGIEKAFSRRPSLILLDLVLPKMNGHLVLKTLRQDVRTVSIPVVVVSAAAEKSQVESAMDEGAREYLIKPFTPDELVSAVSRYLGSEGQ